MDRRNVIKAALCCAGANLLCSVVSMAGTGGQFKIRTNPDLKKRTFPLELRPFWLSTYESRLFFLRSMLDRLGKDTTVTIWNEAFQKPDGGLMQKILSEGWETYAAEEKVEKAVERVLEESNATLGEGISKDEARRLVEMDYFISMARKQFPTLEVKRDLNTYSSLHLRIDGIARLSEAMITSLGKQGELAIYDIIRARRAAQAASEREGAADVIKEYADSVRSKERDVYTAGLDAELVKVTKTEVVSRVKGCEWARYCTEHHPTVGYMIACSTDDAALRAMNDSLRMQRTSTIMEGGEVCDFRVYSV